MQTLLGPSGFGHRSCHQESCGAKARSRATAGEQVGKCWLMAGRNGPSITAAGAQMSPLPRSSRHQAAPATLDHRSCSSARDSLRHGGRAAAGAGVPGEQGCRIRAGNPTGRPGLVKPLCWVFPSVPLLRWIKGKR